MWSLPIVSVHAYLLINVCASWCWENASMTLRECIFSDSVFVFVCVCVCVYQREHGYVWYISVSHLFLRHCGEWEVWISLNPVELTPVSLSARLLNCPVLHWIAASSTDNPQTMSNTDSSTPYSGTSEGDTDHRRKRKTSTELKGCFMLGSVLLC